MITYSWIISSMDTAPSEDGLTDVVVTVHWRYVGVEGEYSAEVYSSYACPAPSPSEFTPYQNLTEAEVTGWLIVGLDVASLQANIATQIENQKNPPVVVLPLPWAPQPPQE